MQYPLKFISKTDDKALTTDALTLASVVERLLFLDSDETLVENGFLAENSLADLAEVYMSDLLGDHVSQQYDNTFPSVAELLKSPAPTKVLKVPSDKDNVCHLLDSDSYTLNVMNLDRALRRDYYILDSFVILYCVEGVGRIAYGDKSELMRKSDVFVVPADLHEVTLVPSANMCLLELYIPTKEKE